MTRAEHSGLASLEDESNSRIHNVRSHKGAEVKFGAFAFLDGASRTEEHTRERDHRYR